MLRPLPQRGLSPGGQSASAAPFRHACFGRVVPDTRGTDPLRLTCSRGRGSRGGGGPARLLLPGAAGHSLPATAQRGDARGEQRGLRALQRRDGESEPQLLQQVGTCWAGGEGGSTFWAVLSPPSTGWGGGRLRGRTGLPGQSHRPAPADFVVLSYLLPFSPSGGGGHNQDYFPWWGVGYMVGLKVWRCIET